MPSIITHKIFAEEVVFSINKTDIERIILRHPHLYYIGAQGPDYLFYHNALPWDTFKDHKVSKLGNRMHSFGTNSFYEEAIHIIKSQKDEKVKERMMAYLFGHLAHWSLDSTAHPYIFYKTGNGSEKSNNHHHRFESTMDTLILKKMRDKSIKDYPCYEICTYDEEMLKAIARIYVPIAKKIYHVDLKVYDVRTALDSWYQIIKTLYDPNNVKYTAFQGIESLIGKRGKFSSLVLKTKEDPQYDVLNEQQQEWVHPCDDSITCNATMFELMDLAKQTCLDVIEKAYGCIVYDAPIQNLKHALGNRSYDTGCGEQKEMIHFDIIYDQE